MAARLEVAVLGGTEILVSRNTITGHDSPAESDFPKAGVTIVAPTTFGVVPPRDIAVVLNAFTRNDLDVAWDELGEGVVVGSSSCTTSLPASLCGAGPAPAAPPVAEPAPAAPAPAAPPAAAPVADAPLAAAPSAP